MQGFGTKKYNLPAPYGLKPRRGKKLKTQVDRVAKSWFTTPQRKLFGYVILLVITGLFIMQLVPIFKPDTEAIEYELDNAVQGAVAAAGMAAAAVGAAAAGKDGSVEDAANAKIELEAAVGALADASGAEVVAEEAKEGLQNVKKAAGQGKKRVVDLTKQVVDDAELAKGEANEAVKQDEEDLAALKNKAKDLRKENKAKLEELVDDGDIA